MAAVLVGGVEAWAGCLADLTGGLLAVVLLVVCRRPTLGTRRLGSRTHGAAVVVCDRVVAGVFLGSWMAAAAEVVVKALDWEWEKVLRAFEAGRVRSMMAVWQRGVKRPRGP